VSKNVLTTVQIGWQLPYNGGTLVTGYVVEIKASSGEWLVESQYCNA